MVGLRTAPQFPKHHLARLVTAPQWQNDHLYGSRVYVESKVHERRRHMDQSPFEHMDCILLV